MKQIIKSAATALIAASITLPVSANIDPKIAEFCLKAQDFQGCVKSMSGDSSGSTTTVRQIQQKGADLAEGNQCPAGFAYIGGGNCQEVKCRDNGGGGNDYRLAGKEWACKKVLGIFGTELVLEGDIVRASINNNCPSKEPAIGYNSSCSSPKPYMVPYMNKNLLERVKGCSKAELEKIEPYSDEYYECMKQAEQLKRDYK